MPADSTGQLLVAAPASATYLKAAFLYHWNLLFVVGGSGAGGAVAASPTRSLPIVGGLEIAYLTGLLAMPRFRTAIDAQGAAKEREATRDRARRSLGAAVVAAHDRVAAAGVGARGSSRCASAASRCATSRQRHPRANGRRRRDSSESIRTPALDRLLFLFLKLLMSQDGLDRFLRSASEKELAARLEETKADSRRRRAAATSARSTRSRTASPTASCVSTIIARA